MEFAFVPFVHAVDGVVHRGVDFVYWGLAVDGCGWALFFGIVGL